MLQGKLIPNPNLSTSKTTLNFDGFVRILDFEATSGNEPSSITIPVNGNIDKEFIIYAFKNSNTSSINARINNVSTSSYYRSFTMNNGGTIGANRETVATMGICGFTSTDFVVGTLRLFFQDGYIPLGCNRQISYISAQTIRAIAEFSYTFNSTSNATSIVLYPSSGNINSGSRLIVFKRSMK
jgi:hypothetical protein